MASSFDTSGFRWRIARMVGSKAEAEERAVRGLAAEFVDGVMSVAPRDTNRYVRGWALAARAAGVGNVTVPSLEPSQYNEYLIDRLELQAHRWAARLTKAKESHSRLAAMYESRYASTGRSGKWERDMAAKVKAAETRVRRTQALHDAAAESLAALKADPTALVIWGRETKREFSKSQLSLVRNKLYGGTGKVERIGDRTIITLHNMEPHSSIVEKQHRVVARALARVRAQGLRKVGRKYIQAMARKAG